MLCGVRCLAHGVWRDAPNNARCATHAVQCTPRNTQTRAYLESAHREVADLGIEGSLSKFFAVQHSRTEFSKLKQRAQGKSDRTRNKKRKGISFGGDPTTQAAHGFGAPAGGSGTGGGAALLRAKQRSAKRAQQRAQAWEAKQAERDAKAKREANQAKAKRDTQNKLLFELVTVLEQDKRKFKRKFNCGTCRKPVVSVALGVGHTDGKCYVCMGELADGTSLVAVTCGDKFHPQSHCQLHLSCAVSQAKYDVHGIYAPDCLAATPSAGAPEERAAARRKRRKEFLDRLLLCGVADGC